MVLLSPDKFLSRKSGESCRKYFCLASWCYNSPSLPTALLGLAKLTTCSTYNFLDHNALPAPLLIKKLRPGC